MAISTIGSNSLSSTSDLTINSVTVGKGGGSVSTNSVLGYQALNLNTTGAYNTGIGYQAAYSNLIGTGLTAVGQGALYLTTGNYNTGVGQGAGYTITSGVNNTAIGYGAIGNQTNTGNNNTSVGHQSMYQMTSGLDNVALGYRAGYNNTTGSQNTLIGNNANFTNAAGQYNSILGKDAGYNNTGSYNTYIGGKNANGYGCAELMTTGSKNTIIGGYNGNQNTLDMRTSNNVIVLSDGDGIPRSWYQSSNFYIAPTGPAGTQYSFDNAEFYAYPDNTAKLGYPSYRWTTVYATTGSINTSDANQKQQIRSLNDSEKAVATRIKSLIKAFKFNDSVAEKGDGARIHVGVIAQEVQAAFIAEGLDPNKYGMFCSDTWYEVDGKKSKPSDPYTAKTEGAVLVTQLGIRYDQLLSFVISAL